MEKDKDDDLDTFKRNMLQKLWKESEKKEEERDKVSDIG